MGCGQKAVADDEDDWDTLCKLAGIDVAWDCYSPQARYAKKGFHKLGLKHSFLKRYVELMYQVDLLIQAQKKSEEAYKTYLDLKKKYEK